MNKPTPIRKVKVEQQDMGAVVCCGRSGIALLFDDEPENYLFHARTLTKAVAGMHRAVYTALKHADIPYKLPKEDLEDALAGVELVANMAAEMARLVPSD